jgi:hypothetical protein
VLLNPCSSNLRRYGRNRQRVLSSYFSPHGFEKLLKVTALHAPENALARTEPLPFAARMSINSRSNMEFSLADSWARRTPVTVPAPPKRLSTPWKANFERVAIPSTTSDREMCGIFAFFSHAQRIPGAVLQRATAAHHHRGPDGERCWTPATAVLSRSIGGPKWSSPSAKVRVQTIY